MVDCCCRRDYNRVVYILRSDYKGKAMTSPVHFFACDDGWHLTLWRLQVYWLTKTKCYWRPWRLMRTAYWLRFAFEWT